MTQANRQSIFVNLVYVHGYSYLLLVLELLDLSLLLLTVQFLVMSH